MSGGGGVRQGEGGRRNERRTRGAEIIRLPRVHPAAAATAMIDQVGRGALY